jgi:hypothetical protein
MIINRLKFGGFVIGSMLAAVDSSSLLSCQFNEKIAL